MITKDYDVSFETREGRLITYTFNDELRSVRVELPEELNHDAFRSYFGKVIEGLMTNRTMLHDTVSRVVKMKNRDKANQSVSKTISRIFKEHGDLDDYKMRWDYNLAPKVHNCEGRFADLKAYIQQRTQR